MHEDEESQQIGGRPSKSARKREAAAAQDLGERLIALKEADIAALQLPEKLFDAIMLAKRINSRGGLARQRQYIGKLMRDVDPAPIEAALIEKSRGAALDAGRHKRI
jgi:ribosome-associated protein